MTDLPYIPLYVADFEGSTSFLSLEEEGLYFRLLRLMWQTPSGTIPNDKKWISRRLRISGDQIEVLDAIIVDFCQVKNGRLLQKRLLEEYKKTSTKISARKKAGKKGGQTKALKNKEITNDKTKDLPKQNSTIQNQNQNHLEKDSKLSEKFDEFWKVYGKPVDKKQSVNQWNTKVKTSKLADKIILAARKYAGSREKTYRKSPMRWLRDENWNDEIIAAQGSLLSERPEDFADEETAGKGW